MKYEVELIQTASVIIEVDSENIEDAEEKALDIAKKDGTFDGYEDCIKVLKGQIVDKINNDTYIHCFTIKE